MILVRAIFSRKWLLATVLVFLAALVMARLGIWQLDRLSARRVFNAHVFEQQAEMPLALNETALDDSLRRMEYREVQVRGTYLAQDEFLLRNQYFGGQLGYHLFTPLLIEGSQQAVIVQRGWIPEDSAGEGQRDAYIVGGLAEVEGILRSPDTDFGLRLIADPTLRPGEMRLDIWNNLDFERLDSQIETPLLDMYVQVLPDGSESAYPRPLPIELNLTEGPHLGYAGQWFLFALVLLVGYPIYVNRQISMDELNQNEL